MSAVYPLGPQEVPANLTAPSSNYKRHAWLAVLGVALFVIAYFALATWFGWTAWRLFSNVAHARTDDVFASLLAGGCSAFLAIFMLKALFFVKHGQASEDVEVTPDDQPELFEFLTRLAKETGAPKPRHVYVSGRVNAAVFYDLSIANLLFPSRKNLEIGLGLVNVLTLGELKAVLAHEFGHFAQKTMAVGRWVYIAQQIAGHIIAKRDMLDTFLVRLSNIDLRLAWIGWLLRIIVWSIRSLVELLFRGVVIAQRALSREMEFQADLVAVSVTGSDALIHALHKLAAADDAWERTLNFASTELNEKRGVKDLFAIQLKIIENTRSLLDDPIYGAAPPMPETQPEAHRVFKVALAAPPRMWATHPANSDREANAKRRYVRAPIDERSAWTIFEEPQKLREQVSRHMVRAKEFTPVDIETSLASLAKDYSRDYLNPRYRGAYLGRSVVRHVSAIDELYDKSPGNATVAELDALYPASLADDIERLRALGEERQMLIALREGFLTAPGGVIQHRGTAMTRKNLPKAIEAVERDLDACAKAVREHDRRCRSLHLAAAQRLGPDWAAYLKGLLEILHYADHVEANLLDAHGALAHTVNVATADGKVSKRELEKIMSAAKIAYNALEEIHTDEAVAKVVPDRTVLKRMNAESWRAALEKLGLPAPNQGNIGDWLNAFGGWVRSTSSSLSSLRLAALEQLLAAENQVAQFTRKGMQPAAAPPASTVPAQYRLLTPGSERPRDAQLTWWDRFQMASGVMPTIARFGVAAAIIGAVLWAASGVGTSIVYVLNGLETTVIAHVNDKQLTVNPGAHVSVDIGRADRVHVSASTVDGRPIETFDANTAGGSSQEIYNVAGAASFVEWTAVYGPASGAPERALGAQRWFSTSVDVVLEEPPKSISTKNGSGATRTVLTGFGEGFSQRILAAIPDEGTQKQVVLTHARWDDSNARNIEEWLGTARQWPEFEPILAARIKDNPRDPVNLRFEQEATTGEQHDAVCRRHRQLAAGAPDNSDLAYVATRCIADGDERDQAFLKLLQRWPENAWIMQASAYVYAGDEKWREASNLFTGAMRKLPQLSDRLALEAARIARVSANGRPVDLRNLQSQSEYLSLMLTPETADVSQAGVWVPYVLMMKGDLARALAIVQKAPGGDPHLLQLIATSDGASAETIEQALALPAENIDGGYIVPMLALTVRAGRDTTTLMQQVSKQLTSDSPRLLNAFTILKNGGTRSQVEQAMRGLEPELRGQMYVAAAVLRGPECPPEWRAAAKQLLFVSERPYLK